MSELVKVGRLIDGPAFRDAIHVAIAPVIAGEYLSPGELVGLVNNDPEKVGSNEPHIGIVDPYLTEDVRLGQRFYVFLFPNTVTSLRHQWAHPAFPEVETVVVEKPVDSDPSVAYLRQMAEDCGISYARLMQAATLWLSDEEYTHMGTNEDYKDAFWDHREEFWRHYENVTKTTVSDKNGSFFSCSC